MFNKKEFQPAWRTTKPLANSYRAAFKWGAPDGFKHPNAKLYTLLKETFKLTDADFNTKVSQGDETVELENKINLSAEQIAQFTDIVGKDNINDDDFNRVKYSYGKTTEEALDLRDKKTDVVSDLVIHPRNRKDIQAIVTYCDEQKIPLYVFGGGSSVTLGLTPEKGGITLVMATHMNKVQSFNEINSTVTVESGIMGPAFESILNNAPELYNAKTAYTCGHFPQSFEFSTVGGWIAAKGSGQQSSYYGDACDLVISQEYITPAGHFKTHEYPATATGPMVNDIMKGTEGTYGVLVSATMKIFKYMPENRKKFSFIFPSWQDAVNASAEISQNESGMPSVFRISDAEETWVGLKQHGLEGTLVDKLMIAKGFKPMQRCLCLGHTEGEKKFSANAYKNIKKICKKHGAMSLTGYPVKLWEKNKFNDPYIREDMNDYGIVIDTLETGVTWDTLHQVHLGVRAYIKKRPDTICMTHCSHIYPQGTNLYFIFIGKFQSKQEFKEFHTGIIEHIEKTGGSLSHHHGVGRLMSGLMEKHLGKEQLDILRALKKHFDPNGIMNPGSTLGL